VRRLRSPSGCSTRRTRHDDLAKRIGRQPCVEFVNKVVPYREIAESSEAAHHYKRAAEPDRPFPPNLTPSLPTGEPRANDDIPVPFRNPLIVAGLAAQQQALVSPLRTCLRQGRRAVVSMMWAG
jgi:hypothetical protein